MVANVVHPSRRNGPGRIMFAASIASLVAPVLNHPLGQALLVISGTFVLEDAATVITAMQVSVGAISLPVGLGALYAGIVCGDLGLYALGRLSARIRWTERLIPHRRRDLGRAWLAERTVKLVLISRFIPGLRVPTYTTCGFLRAPLGAFVLAAVAATLIWTSFLFGISLKLGQILLAWLGVWRWAGGIGFAIAVVLIGRTVARHFDKTVLP